MLKTAQKHLSLILVIVVSLGFVGFALAHETATAHPHALAQADTQASAEVNVSATAPRPLDLVRQRAMEIKQSAVDAKAQLRATTQAELQEAETPEERRAVLQGATGARVDIAQDRMQAGVKNLIRLHAGLVKERLVLAQRQFERMSARIQSRLDKMEAEGIDTASVQAKLDAAIAANVQAKADAQAVADYIASVDDSADRATVKAELEAKIKTAQASIKATHSALSEAVRALVALAKANKPAASVDTSASASVEAGAAVTNE